MKKKTIEKMIKTMQKKKKKMYILGTNTAVGGFECREAYYCT